MTEVKKTVYVLRNGKYEVSNETTDKETVYTDLARDLIHKKMENYQDITRICAKRSCAAY